MEGLGLVRDTDLSLSSSQFWGSVTSRLGLILALHAPKKFMGQKCLFEDILKLCPERKLVVDDETKCKKLGEVSRDFGTV